MSQFVNVKYSNLLFRFGYLSCVKVGGCDHFKCTICQGNVRWTEMLSCQERLKSSVFSKYSNATDRCIREAVDILQKCNDRECAFATYETERLDGGFTGSSLRDWVTAVKQMTAAMRLLKWCKVVAAMRVLSPLDAVLLKQSLKRGEDVIGKLVDTLDDPTEQRGQAPDPTVFLKSVQEAATELKRGAWRLRFRSDLGGE